MLKRYAFWFGVLFLVVGLLGFVPPVAPRGYLLGAFAVDATHNIVHLLTGAAALWVGVTSERSARRFFQIFGVAYGLVALIGFFYGNSPLLGIMAHNVADAWLHVAIATFALYMGFAYRRHGPATAWR